MNFEGGMCPGCGSTDLHYEDSGLEMMEGQQYFYNFVCNACNKSYTEWFKLVYEATYPKEKE